MKLKIKEKSPLGKLLREMRYLREWLNHGASNLVQQ